MVVDSASILSLTELTDMYCRAFLYTFFSHIFCSIYIYIYINHDVTGIPCSIGMCWFVKGSGMAMLLTVPSNV